VRCGGPLSLFGGRGPDGQHRLATRDAACQSGELAGVAEGLEVQHNRVGSVVVFPPQQHVVAAHVVLVAGGHEVGGAPADPVQLLGDRDGDAPGLRDQTDVPGGGAGSGERGVHPHVGRARRHPEAVRADQPHAVSVNGVHQAFHQSRVV
jgi:hypothetical protein